MITCYFGLPGVGKSTILTCLAQRELRRIAKGKSKYEIVCTNYYCQDCIQLTYKQLGNVKLQNALVLLDELTLDAGLLKRKKNSLCNIEKIMLTLFILLRPGME